MMHYQQSFIVKASPSAIYAALTTPDGLSRWWTQDCDVATEVGGTIQFRFGRSRKNMRIELLEPDREVRWLCTDAYIDVAYLNRKDEWVDTQIVFRLAPEGKEHTRLGFDHIGLLPSLECYDLCNNGWQYFLGSLQQFLETGKGTPHERGDECKDKPEIRSE
jgi:uncharacterized protein YndB with AHSA1/START domain